MATPTVAASLDKQKYQPGETMTLTVSYSDADTQPVSVTISVTDSTGNVSDPVTVTAVIDSVIIGITDDSGREWVPQSDTGSVAVYTAVA